jgi:TonB family protein
MSCPDPYRPYDPSGESDALEAELKVQHLPSDSEMRALTSALAAGGGGSSSPDLALDLVLNQIVEQACLATGATGAAIALTRDGEMVCRATTGRNAPDLGVRLDNAGFSAECLRVGTLQRCDDTETDPRVDAMACRLLGVRSILVIPLWYWGEFMGIFEIFSPRPNAFGERDEQTLQALAYRIVRHTKQATGSIAGFTSNVEEVPEPMPSLVSPVPEPEPELEPQPTRAAVLSMPVFEFNSAGEAIPVTAASERPDTWTAVLAGAAVVIAGLIVGLMIWRVAWGGVATKGTVISPTAVKAGTHTTAPAAGDASVSAVHEEILEFGSPPSTPKLSATPNVPVMAAKKESIAPSGQPGLAIYEKGKLIYGSPVTAPDQPVAKPLQPKAQAAPRDVDESALAKLDAPPSVVGAARLSPEAAENLLVNRVEPEYPDAARRARIQGSVTLQTLIGADGKVQRVTPVSGNPELTAAAITAVLQWRYKPYVMDGRKVPVRTQVSVTFMLAE